jgi:hypothetical protein
VVGFPGASHQAGGYVEDFCPSSVIPNYKNAPQSENLVHGGPGETTILRSRNCILRSI